MCLGLQFYWLNHVPVPAVAEAVQCSSKTAVDQYSMTREICEVVTSHEILSRILDGKSANVEMDKCYLTRRKYHKGRHPRSKQSPCSECTNATRKSGSTSRCATTDSLAPMSVGRRAATDTLSSSIKENSHHQKTHKTLRCSTDG